jgi:hypothetical protein
MKKKKKLILVFIVLFIFLFLSFSVLTNFILPVKTSMISGNVGRYSSEDILFYSESESYTINDYIIYRPTSKQVSIIAEIIEINSNGTFKVIGINPEPIEKLDQNNLKKEQIMGKIFYSMSMYIFYPIVITICIISAFILTHFILKKLKL